MGKKVRSYKGKVIDFDEFMATNNRENTQAVGNMDVNARGDVIDSKGKVIKTREEVAREYNKQTTKAVVSSSLLDDIDEGVTELKDDPRVLNRKKAEAEQKSKAKTTKKEDDTKTSDTAKKSDSKEKDDGDE